MTRDARRRALASAGAALLAVAALAAALPRLVLRPGLPPLLVKGGGPGSARFTGVAPVAVPVSGLALVVLGVALAAALACLIYGVVRGTSWASVLRMALVAAAASGALSGLLVLLALALPSARAGVPVAPPPAPPPRAATPLGAPPPLLLWVAALALAAGATLALVSLLRPSRRRADPLLDIALEAERARRALLDGDDPRSVILACYEQMTTALERHVERQASTTARELEAMLAGLGLPTAAVHELTGLFEAVRYGGWPGDPAAQARAGACLDLIVQHCRGAPGGDG